MAEATNARVLDNIGQEMVDAKLISADQLAVAKETKKNLGGDLGHILIKKGFVTEEQTLEFLNHHLKVPFISLKDYKVDPDVTKLVAVSLARKYNLMPLFREDDVVTVAMADPLNVFALDDIRNSLKYRVRPMLASASEIEQLIRDNYRLLEAEDHQASEVEVIKYGGESEAEVAERLKEMGSGAKVVSEVSRIIQSSADEGASDIHIEPLGNSLKVRIRVDGVLQERMILAKAMHQPIVSRIKIMSEMDIAERRVPQDGRVRVKIAGNKIDMRVSTYPTMHGEKVVIRLLSRGEIISLEDLGFEDAERKKFERLINKPYGVLLVTGPTGSGKTTTLYSALQRINSQDKNIISIEDPVENELAGISQAQVNNKAGMTFAAALRSILRQDPDVIMIGEIRDPETADIAVRSAITGHLVFSTLHTNTAIGAISRLADLGVEPFLISSGLIGLIAQRLVRCICSNCKEVVKKSEAKPERIGIEGNPDFFKGKGCKECRMTGYSGRLGLFEFVEVDAQLCSLIAKGAKDSTLTEVVRKSGVKSLRARGIDRVLAGQTTVDEVLRVTEADE